MNHAQKTVGAPLQSRAPDAQTQPTDSHCLASCRHAVALWLLASIVSLTGCTTLTPSLPPDLNAASAGFTQAVPASSAGLDAATWRGFGDPALESLIAQARDANLDVRIAQQRVRQARAGSTAAASRLWPTVAATASVSDQRTGLPAEVKRGSPDTRAIRGAIDLGWELDVFGAARPAPRWRANTSCGKGPACACFNCRRCFRRSKTPNA
jgi:Outer membrane efflux protein